MANTTETRRPDRRPGETEAPRRDAPRLSADAAPVRNRPANENDPGTAGMLARLRRRPSGMPYGLLAFFLAAVWTGGWFFANADIFARMSGANPLSFATLLQSIALLLLPIAVIAGTAYLLFRAADLRNVSEVLTQSAMRLIRPQDVATEGLTTIAQAVRSEVDLLVGGVEHAVQRAAVLEEIVHKEIAAIERAFGGNEERIRSLVTGIENQRSALHQATLVINNEANPLIARLETNTKNLEGIIGTAHDTLGRLEVGLRDMAGGVVRALDDMTERANSAGAEIGVQTTHMEDVSGQMVGRLRDFSRLLNGQIEQLSQVTGTLHGDSVDFGRSVQDMEAGMSQTVRNSIDQLTNINQDIARTIERASITSADQIKLQAADLAETVQNASNTLAYHLKSSADEVTQTIERAGVETSQMIDQSRGQVTQGLQTVEAEFLDRVDHTRDDLDS